MLENHGVQLGRVKPASQVRQHPLSMSFETIHTHYDPTYSALWCEIQSSIAPVFSVTLLKNIRLLQDLIAQYVHECPNKKPKYLIWHTNNSKVFNLGLDLAYVHEQVLSRNKAALYDYIQLCIDVFYINLMKLDIAPLITMSLIRGKAYGGGFEAALSSDVIITEKNAKCCFPEVKYHLLPSFGTLKMLFRKYPPSAMQALVFESKRLSLSHLKTLGFVEAIAKNKNGELCVMEKIKKIHRDHELMYHLFNAKLRDIIISHQELDEFRDNWINTALKLKPDEIFRLNRLAEAQKRICKANK